MIRLALVLLLVAAVLMAPAARAQADGARPEEARRQAEALLRQHFFLGNKPIRGVAFSSERMELQTEDGTQPYVLKDMPLQISGSFFDIYRVAIGPGPRLHTGGSNRAQAEQLVSVLGRLQAASAKSSDPALETAFAEAASRYRSADPKPQFPEEARRLRVQAEAMLREKRFADAAELYGEALRVAPWWPEGRFNRALVLGEIREFNEAIREMRRYLLLVPEAPNARAAQDKIYEWEAMEARR